MADANIDIWPPPPRWPMEEGIIGKLIMDGVGHSLDFA